MLEVIFSSAMSVEFVKMNQKYPHDFLPILKIEGAIIIIQI